MQGPIARTLEDIILYNKSVIDTEPWFKDPKLHPIPWRTINLPQNLKFAVMWNDGFVDLTPPVKRALQVTVEKLRSAGHEIVSWDTTGVSKLYSSMVLPSRNLPLFLSNLTVPRVVYSALMMATQFANLSKLARNHGQSFYPLSPTPKKLALTKCGS